MRNALVASESPTGRYQIFDTPGIALQFAYPTDFKVEDLKGNARLAGQGTRAAVGLGGYDQLIVSRYPGQKVRVTVRNLLALKPQFDRVVDRQLGVKIVGETGTIDGLPAISWPREPVPGLPVTEQLVNIFLGHDEYELQCQAVPQHVDTIISACDEMLTTLTH